MVGRRQLREKILQTLYSYENNNISKNILEKNMFTAIENIYHLYLYQLNLLIELKSLANERITTNKNKKFPTQDDLNPNKRFIDNPILSLIENNLERKDFTSNHMELMWKNESHYAQTILNKLYKDDEYKKYMSKEVVTFKDHKSFIQYLFTEYIAYNESLHELYEEKNLYWADDYHIVHSMVLKTIIFFKEYTSINTLIKIFKDDEDRQFTRNLLLQTINHDSELTEIISKNLINWDIKRITIIDLSILKMAFTELKYYPQTPTNVIINEYIELAKIFSTLKSKSFINGMLDKFSKELNRD